LKVESKNQVRDRGGVRKDVHRHKRKAGEQATRCQKKKNETTAQGKKRKSKTRKGCSEKNCSSTRASNRGEKFFCKDAKEKKNLTAGGQARTYSKKKGARGGWPNGSGLRNNSKGLRIHGKTGRVCRDAVWEDVHWRKKISPN